MPRKHTPTNAWLQEAEVRRLIVEASRARQHAFCHRSKHRIGASVLTQEGEVFGGCNVESVISGLGTCAERCAIDHAVVHGHYHFRAICCVDDRLTPCCGACLQYLVLFSQVSGSEIYLVNADTKGHYEIEKLSDALPDGYRTKNNLELLHAYRHRSAKRKGRKSRKSA
jgi:cytidine deaminase